MKTFLNKKSVFFIVLIFLCFNVFLPIASANVFSDITKKLGDFNQGAQLPTNVSQSENIIVLIISIINVALTFLGLIFIVLILYGGFTYMTAAGDSKRTEKAVNIMKDSVIGVAIIFISYGLVNYVIEEAIKLFE